MKPWYKSKTIWVNSVAAGLIALEASTGVLKPLLGDPFYMIMSAVLSVVNAVLRTITKVPLGKPAETQETQP